MLAMPSVSMDSWKFLRCDFPLKLWDESNLMTDHLAGGALGYYSCHSQQFSWRCPVIQINVASKFFSIFTLMNGRGKNTLLCFFYQPAECLMTGQALHLHYLGWMQQVVLGQEGELSLLPGNVPMFYVFWQDFPRDNDVTAQVRGRRDGGGGSFNCHRCGPGTVTQNTSF